MNLAFVDFENEVVVTTDGTTALYRKMDSDHETITDPICTDKGRIAKLDNAVRVPADNLKARVLVDSDRLIEMLHYAGAGCVEIDIYKATKDGFLIAVSGSSQAAAVMSMQSNNKYWRPFEK